MLAKTLSFIQVWFQNRRAKFRRNEPSSRSKLFELNFPIGNSSQNSNQSVNKTTDKNTKCPTNTNLTNDSQYPVISSFLDFQTTKKSTSTSNDSPYKEIKSLSSNAIETINTDSNNSTAITTSSINDQTDSQTLNTSYLDTTNPNTLYYENETTNQNYSRSPAPPPPPSGSETLNDSTSSLFDNSLAAFNYSDLFTGFDFDNIEIDLNFMNNDSQLDSILGNYGNYNQHIISK